MQSWLTGSLCSLTKLPNIRLALVLLVPLLINVANGAEGIVFPKPIAWSAYQTGTGGYSQAVAIGNILQRQYQTNLRVIPGRNDVSRLATLRAGRVHFSAGGSEAIYAQEGVLNFASRIWGPQPIRVLMSNYSDSCSYTLVTATDANIRSVADIKGKRVTFVQGAPSLNNAMAALLSYANLTWDDVTRVEVGGYNASADAVVNNRADVVGALAIRRLFCASKLHLGVSPFQSCPMAMRTQLPGSVQGCLGMCLILLWKDQLYLQKG